MAQLYGTHAPGFQLQAGLAGLVCQAARFTVTTKCSPGSHFCLVQNLARFTFCPVARFVHLARLPGSAPPGSARFLSTTQIVEAMQSAGIFFEVEGDSQTKEGSVETPAFPDGWLKVLADTGARVQGPGLSSRGQGPWPGARAQGPTFFKNK